MYAQSCAYASIRQESHAVYSMVWKISIKVLMILAACLCTEVHAVDLGVPDDHAKYVLSHHESIAEECASNEVCPYKNFTEDGVNHYCWGYEESCDRQHSYASKRAKNCDRTEFDKDFWQRADFGYVSNIVEELKGLQLCTPSQKNDSSFTCSRNLRFCLAKNIYLDFRKHKPGNGRFEAGTLHEGMVGGHCTLNSELLSQQGKHAFPLQSWFSELGNYTSLDFMPLDDHAHCDVMIKVPTILMKLDSGINLYHHFCDFFNLYLSQHVNNSWFGQDNQIVMWDTSKLGYFDMFYDAWQAFTVRPVVNLQDWVGKRICLRDAMFPLLPRMRGGLFYNTYVPPGCTGSNLFRAFSEHFLYRMGVTQDLPVQPMKIRVTLLQRGDPAQTNVYRQIKNQDELLAVLGEFPDFEVKVVEYNWKKMKFKDQLHSTHNSDIFIGMHGAGLLHFLFLPDWAVAFELYNCGDTNCYRDLARLRGLDYITWEKGDVKSYDQGKHHRYGDNPKFWNWSFDTNEFRRLMNKARELLLKNPLFQRRTEKAEMKVQHKNTEL